MGYAGIGEDDVERSVFLFNVRNNGIRLLRAPNVKGVEFRAATAALQLICNLAALLFENIGYDHMIADFVECVGAGAADANPTASDNHDLLTHLRFHAPL